MSKYKMPKDFRWKLLCKDCEYSVDANGRDSIECMDESLARHIEASGHTKYELDIYNYDIESLKERRDIINIFDDIDDALSLSDVMRVLKELGHDNAAELIIDAMRDDILYVDDIEDDGKIYIALAELGEDMWNNYHEQSDDERSGD